MDFATIRFPMKLRLLFLSFLACLLIGGEGLSSEAQDIQTIKEAVKFRKVPLPKRVKKVEPTVEILEEEVTVQRAFIADPTEEELIPDEGLRGAIRRELASLGYSEITLENLLEITSLDTDDTGLSPSIESLEGIQHCINLVSLILNDNRNLTDISPLSTLENLEHLNLNNSQIQDLTPLESESLRSLTYLSLRDNDAIEDISPLGNLQHLQTLLLDGSDNIGIGFASITSLPELLELSIVIRWHMVGILDRFGNINSLTNLKIERGWGDFTIDYRFVTSLPNLTKLEIREPIFSIRTFNIETLNGLEEQLEELRLSAGNFTNVNLLSSFTNLKLLAMNITSYGFIDINSVNLPNLETLILVAGMIEDLSFLENMTRLKSLDLHLNWIRDLGSLIISFRKGSFSEEGSYIDLRHNLIFNGSRFSPWDIKSILIIATLRMSGVEVITE